MSEDAIVNPVSESFLINKWKYSIDIPPRILFCHWIKIPKVNQLTENSSTDDVI